MYSFENFATNFITDKGIIFWDDFIKGLSPYFGYLQNQTGNNLLITNNENFMEWFFAGIAANKHIYLLSGAVKKIPQDIEFIDVSNFDKIRYASSIKIDFEKIDTKNVFISFCTSGSTSVPKIINKTLDNMIVEALEILDEIKIDKKYNFYTTTKFSHLFGTTFCLFVPFVNGNNICTTQISYPEQIRDDNFVFVSTPAFLSRIEKYDMPTLTAPKLIISAGDKLSEKVYNYYENKSEILEIYGSTETGVIAHKNKYGDNFTPFKNVNISQQTSDCFEIRSNFFDDDKFVINDKIVIFDDKTFQFLQRSDRIIKINEKRVNAQELEEQIIKNDFVEDAYCIKVGEKLCTIIVLSKESKNRSIIEIKNSVKETLRDFVDFYPNKWRFLPEIPKTETGKISSSKIKQMFDGTLTFPIITAYSKTDNIIKLNLIFDKNSNFFEGHFNDFPILPGVVQLYYAHFLAKFYFDIEIPLSSVKKVKFSKIIPPNVNLELQMSNNDKSVDFKYIMDGKVVSSGVFFK